MHNERRSLLVLVSGLSRAGKSMFARQLCEAIASAQHLPFARAVERIRRTLAM